MIYFLVNNDYHLFDAERHAKDLLAMGSAAVLICVPHTLNCEAEPGSFAETLTVPSPLKNRSWLKAWPLYWRVACRLAREFRPSSDDVLIVYTEYELVNQMLINRFHRAGAAVLHVEDGGVGTYLPFAKLPSERLNWKERVIAGMTLLLPGLWNTRFHKINGVVFPWRPDRMFEALCVYRQVAVARGMPVRVIKGAKQASVAELRPGRVLFLNERIYDHYQDEQRYVDGLDRILDALSRGYAEVLFKFHPRETDDWKDKIRARVAAAHPAVAIIEEQAPVETLLADYAPEALASYFATTLLNLEGTGIEPLYLYHLLDDLADQPMFRQLTHLLRQWDYRFAASWDEVRSGYRSQMRFHTNRKPESFPHLVTALARRPH